VTERQSGSGSIWMQASMNIEQIQKVLLSHSARDRLQLTQHQFVICHIGGWWCYSIATLHRYFWSHENCEVVTFEIALFCQISHCKL